MQEINKFIAEFIGTFIFLGIILQTGSAIPIGIALIAVIYLIGSISGGHVNPAVSIIMFCKGSINFTTLLMYIIAQLAGALLAYMWWSKNKMITGV
jgi:aquaporin Z